MYWLFPRQTTADVFISLVQLQLSLFRLHLHSPPQRCFPFSSGVIWSESGIGATFVYLSATLSCVIVFSSAICRPSSSRLRLRDQFVLFRVSLVSVFSRLSCRPYPVSAVMTVVCVHARKETSRNNILGNFRHNEDFLFNQFTSRVKRYVKWCGCLCIKSNKCDHSNFPVMLLIMLYNMVL